MRNLLILLLLICTSWAANADSGQSAIWKSLGAWSIRVDTSLRNSCFALIVYESGTILRLGFNKRDGNGYVVIGNPNWKSLEYGKEYPLVWDFDGAEWAAAATGIKFDNESTVFLWTVFDSAKVISDFMRKQRLGVKYQNREIAALSLRGSHQAGEEMIKCQVEMDANSAPKSRDPFSPARGGSRSRDPFSD